MASREVGGFGDLIGLGPASFDKCQQTPRRPTVTARGALDGLLLQSGTRKPDPVVVAAVDRAVQTLSLPDTAWATAALWRWRRDRPTPDDPLDAPPPDWSQATYPALPDGTVVVRLTPESFIDDLGETVRNDAPLPPHHVYATLNIPESGEYVLVLRAAAGRYKGAGSILVFETDFVWGKLLGNVMGKEDTGSSDHSERGVGSLWMLDNLGR